MRIFIIIISAVLLGCSSEDVIQKIVVDGSTDIVLSFESALETVEEGQSIEIKLDLTKVAASSGSVELSFSSDNGVYGDDFTTEPAFSDGKTSIPFEVGTESISLQINTLVDNDQDIELINFSITNTSGGFKIDTDSDDVLVRIEDKPEDVLPSEDILTVATWNIEQYPKNGTTTINAVKDIILNMDVDIIALQEIDDIGAFNTLVDELAGWEGKLFDVRGGIELAYLYKTSEITSFSNLSIIFGDDRNAFPRQPVLATATHRNGLEVTIFNIHLKCCGLTGSDDANRRETASLALQEYIDTNLPNDNVFVVGDWNDDISDGPFDNFLSDSDNYVFADFDIGNGSSANWSYPSWPSHLDHILITNELFDNHISTETLKLDQTTSNYISNVSDHRPVLASFSN